MKTQEFLSRLAIVKLQKEDLYDELLQLPIAQVMQVMSVADDVVSDPEFLIILKKHKIRRLCNEVSQ